MKEARTFPKETDENGRWDAAIAVLQENGNTPMTLMQIARAAWGSYPHTRASDHATLRRMIQAGELKDAPRCPNKFIINVPE